MNTIIKQIIGIVLFIVFNVIYFFHIPLLNNISLPLVDITLNILIYKIMKYSLKKNNINLYKNY